MKKALLSILFSITMILALAEPFSLYASGDSFDSVNYQLVDYVSPNGNNIHINVGYSIKKTTSINSTFSYTSVMTGRRLYGCNDSSNYYGLGLSSTGKLVVRYTSGNSTKTFSDGFAADTVFDFDQGETVSSATDGVNTYTSTTYTQPNNINTSMVIFGHNAAGSVVNYYTTARLYNMEIYESSVLVHHYYPCYRKSDNVVGVFDGVTNTFYTGTGGNLSYGSVVSSNYTITTDVSPSGSGTVSGGGSYASGSVITLTATAYSGYVFDHWNDNDTSNPKSVTVTSDTTFTAYFVSESTPTPSYTVSLDVSPSGSGTVSGSGSYVSGTSVSISATPSSGYDFVKWSDDNTVNPRTIVVSDDITLTAIFQQQSVTPDPEPPTPPSGWVDWTDENDSEYLTEVNDIDLSKIYWSFQRKRVIDYIQVYQSSINVNSNYNGSNINHVAFTGTYYDNSIVGLTGCNSSTYNYNTSTQTTTDVLNITPAIYGEFDSNIGNEEGILFDFGIAVNSNSSSQVSTTTNGFSNSTEACRLLGMNDGDGSIDGTTLLAAGYQKKTVTYNDGSANGHTATFYVPGSEEFSFAADLSFLDDLLEQIQMTVVNNAKVYYHDDFILSLHGKDGYLLPEYGSAYSKAFIGMLFAPFDWDYLDMKFNYVPSDNVYVDYNNMFKYTLTDNQYSSNKVNLYWQGTRNPSWIFKNDLDQYSIGFDNIVFNDLYIINDYGGRVYTGDSYTVSSSVADDTDLVSGSLLYLNFDSFNFYRYSSNSLLNRFNQLGSFLQSWFTRIYNSIGNITGGNESNEIINNVVTDYDIDVETNFNGLLTNVKDKEEQIDLTLPEYNIPQSDLTGINALAGSFKGLYQDVFIDNGLGILVLIPILLLVLRLIL